MTGVWSGWNLVSQSQRQSNQSTLACDQEITAITAEEISWILYFWAIQIRLISNVKIRSSVVYNVQENLYSASLAIIMLRY